LAIVAALSGGCLGVPSAGDDAGGDAGNRDAGDDDDAAIDASVPTLIADWYGPLDGDAIADRYGLHDAFCNLNCPVEAGAKRSRSAAPRPERCHRTPRST